MSDIARLAQNMARNCGYAVFPCQADKTPRTPRGFKDATTDHEEIAELWRRYPAPLIGIATGAGSGLSVLDLDRKHAPARAWWRANCTRLLPTRTYETLSGGLHLYFHHADGVTNTASKICRGVDTRGEGGTSYSGSQSGSHAFPASPGTLPASRVACLAPRRSDPPETQAGARYRLNTC